MSAFECLPLDKVKDKWEQCAGRTSTVPYFPIEIELFYYYGEPSLSKVPYERMLGCVTTRGGEKRITKIYTIFELLKALFQSKSKCDAFELWRFILMQISSFLQGFLHLASFWKWAFSKLSLFVH